MKHIVKRHGHNEEYDERKLYASIFAACLTVRVYPGTAELTAKEVVANVEKWLEKKHEVTSNDIRRIAARELKEINPDAAHMYTHHRMIG